MKPQYRILISSLDAFGHINCTLGFGELLSEAGHAVTFTQRQRHKPLADTRGFDFIPFEEAIFIDRPVQPTVEWILKNLDKFRSGPLERFRDWTDEDRKVFGAMIEDHETLNLALTKVLEDHRSSFDLLIGDFSVPFPVLHTSPIPYIPLWSMNPVGIYPQGPPVYSGYPVGVEEQKALEFETIYKDACSVLIDNFNSWFKGHNVPTKATEDRRIFKPKYFGFYHYPELLDYSECGPKVSESWIRVDNSVRRFAERDEFVVPQSIAHLPGNLIYFSLGSLGSADVDLMNKLIQILSHSPHRFIVSKGPRGDEIALGENMWGENYVDQIAVLKVVDMVITHGGNNTFLETILHGKPMIVIPFFFDQFDNAQRAVDCGIGRRLDVDDLNQETLLNLVEETLRDTRMMTNINKVADSMRSSQSRSKAVEMVEDFIEDMRNNNFV